MQALRPSSCKPLHVPFLLAVMTNDVLINPTRGHGVSTDPTAVAGRYEFARFGKSSRRLVHLKLRVTVASSREVPRLVLQSLHTLRGGFHVERGLHGLRVVQLRVREKTSLNGVVVYAADDPISQHRLQRASETAEFG